MIWNEKVRPWETAAAGVALLIAILFLLQWGIEGVIHNRKTQVMPDLKGGSITAALDRLAPIELGLRKESAEFNNGVPIGSILRQDPPAGTVVREGKIVRVVVSQGGETELTPAIVGLPLRNAEMLLHQSQLGLGKVSESYSLRLDKGVVISQDPKAEASVGRNSLINVTVSGGAPPPEVSLMPDLLRKHIEEAQAWAGVAGAVLTVQKDMGSPFAYGTILSQEPAPDASLVAKAQVSVVISGREVKPGENGLAATHFHYELPPGGSESLVRIAVSDKYGERELFNGLRRPGAKIDIPVQESGGAHVRIFLNGILVDERDL